MQNCWSWKAKRKIFPHFSAIVLVPIVRKIFFPMMEDYVVSFSRCRNGEFSSTNTTRWREARKSLLAVLVLEVWVNNNNKSTNMRINVCKKLLYGRCACAARCTFLWCYVNLFPSPAWFEWKITCSLLWRARKDCSGSIGRRTFWHESEKKLNNKDNAMIWLEAKKNAMVMWISRLLPRQLWFRTFQKKLHF